MRQILAIAYLTLKTAIRYKIFIVLFFILLGIHIFLPALLEGDGTLKGKISIILRYSLNFSVFILSIATLWISCGILCGEIDNRQIYLIVTKPVSFFRIWLGKWLGVLFLNTTLLVVSAGAVYGLLWWVVHHGEVSGEDAQLLSKKLLVARTVVLPKKFAAGATAALLHKEQSAPRIAGQVQRRTAAVLKKDRISIAPGASHKWVFEGITIPRQEDTSIFIKYRFFVAGAKQRKKTKALWKVGEPGLAQYYYLEIESTPEVYHEIDVPSLAVSKDGVFAVEYVNQGEKTVTFPGGKSMAVLFQTSPFWYNYVQCVLILLFKLTLLSTLGLAIASFTSFPVAVFVSMSLYAMSLFSGFLGSLQAHFAFLELQGVSLDEIASGMVENVSIWISQRIVFVLSRIHAYNPLDRLCDGIAIGGFTILEAFTWLIVVQGGLLTVLGVWAYSRRQMAS